MIALLLLVALPVLMYFSVIKREQFTTMFFILVWLVVTASDIIHNGVLSPQQLAVSLGATLGVYAVACILPFIAGVIYYSIHKKAPVWVLWPAYLLAVPLLFVAISQGEVASFKANIELFIVFVVACAALAGLFFLDFSRTRKVPDKKEPQKPPIPQPTKPAQTTSIDEYAVASKIAALISQTAAENPSALSQQSTYSIALNQDGRVALVKTSFVELLPSKPIAAIDIRQIEGRSSLQVAIESEVFLEQEIDAFSVKVLRALLAAQRKEQNSLSGLSQPQSHETQAPTIRTDKRFVVGLEEKADDKKMQASFILGAVILIVFGAAVYFTKKSNSSGSAASTVSDTAIYESVEAPEDAAAAAQDSAAQAAQAAMDAANAATEAVMMESAAAAHDALKAAMVDEAREAFFALPENQIFNAGGVEFEIFEKEYWRVAEAYPNEPEAKKLEAARYLTSWQVELPDPLP